MVTKQQNDKSRLKYDVITEKYHKCAKRHQAGDYTMLHWSSSVLHNSLLWSQLSVRLTALLSPLVALCLINSTTVQTKASYLRLWHPKICWLTCSIQGPSIRPAPRQVWDRDSNSPTAEQHIVSNSAPDSCHSCVDTWQLTAPQLCVTEQDPRHTLWCWTPQPCVDERHRESWRLLELDQVIESAVTHPGVVMETWVWGYKWGYRR